MTTQYATMRAIYVTIHARQIHATPFTLVKLNYYYKDVIFSSMQVSHNLI